MFWAEPKTDYVALPKTPARGDVFSPLEPYMFSDIPLRTKYKG